jgi:hypothetical protein
MIDILNTTRLQNTISKLNANAKPLWGKMSPQNIIEHLAGAVKMSTGKVIVKRYTTPEEAQVIKEKLINTPAEIPAGVKNPLLTDEAPALMHKDLDAAVAELFNEINYFKEYYKQNPNAIHTHLRMGDLTHGEWLTLHNKHFTHHFKQYNLFS